MTIEEIKSINLQGGLPEKEITKRIRTILRDAMAYVRLRDSELLFSGCNTVLAQRLAICSKCECLHMCGRYKLVPISFVAAITYHADFNGGDGVKSFVVANRYLKKDIAKRHDLQRKLRGHSAVPRYYEDKSAYFNERQLDIMYQFHLSPSSKEVYRLWRQVRVWNIHVERVDWFAQGQPTIQEYLALLDYKKTCKKTCKKSNKK